MMRRSRSRSPGRYRRELRSRERDRDREQRPYNSSNINNAHSYQHKRLIDEPLVIERRERRRISISPDRRRKEKSKEPKMRLEPLFVPPLGLDKADFNEVEENYLDPSICNFDVQKTVQDNSNERLDRLEKMVETLIMQKQNDYKENCKNHAVGDPYELIPSNQSFTTSMWLNKISEECLRNNFDEKRCIHFLQSKASGIVKAWLNTIDIRDFSWPELKMLITRCFPDNTDFARTLRLIVNKFKLPDESIIQYYFTKMYLLEACKITGPDAVSCLIDGLDDSYLIQEAKNQNFFSPESFFSQFLLNLPIQAEKSGENIVSPHRDVEVYQEVNTKTSSSKKNCYTCGKKGHVAADCRHAPVCYRCNKHGHIAAKCSI